MIIPLWIEGLGTVFNIASIAGLVFTYTHSQKFSVSIMIPAVIPVTPIQPRSIIPHNIPPPVPVAQVPQQVPQHIPPGQPRLSVPPPTYRATQNPPRIRPAPARIPVPPSTVSVAGPRATPAVSARPVPVAAPARVKKQVDPSSKSLPDHTLPKGQFLSMNAADGKFWLGRSSQTRCKSWIKLFCNKHPETVFKYRPSDKSVYLDIQSLKGQKVYISNKDGAVSFTRPKEKISKADAIQGYFQYDMAKGDSTYGTLKYFLVGDLEPRRWKACPVLVGGRKTFKIVVDIHSNSNSITGCIDAWAGTTNPSVNILQGSWTSYW
jgi:hypothetical protein